MEKIIREIKTKSDDFITSLGFEGESVITQERHTIIVNYQVDDAAMLIGKGGEVLDALQHVMRILYSKQLLNTDYDLVVDVSGYRSKKAEVLAKRAKDKAFQVLATGIEEIMPPMSSYERMIVHTTCANIADITTESSGSGRERRVVIKPKKG